MGIMHKKRKIIAVYCMIFAWVLIFSGCGKTEPEENKNTGQSVVIENLANRETDISSHLAFQGSMELHYAERFAVDYYDGGYILLTVADERRFLVAPEGEEAPEDLPEDIVVLKRPVENLYLVATAVMDMFRELDALSSIRFSGQKAEGWYIEEARKAVETGDMLYAGKYNMPDYEVIVSEGCSLAIENTMISHAPEVIEKLESFGIPVLIDYSSYESHPLGRVEWIKFYGALLGKEEEALEAFREQEDILERVSQEARSGKTVAFFYITTNGAVNVRKSSDYVPKMIALAGGQYIFADLGSDSDYKSSVTMQMEEFYAAAKEADYLIYNSTIDGEIHFIEELLEKSNMLEDFKAVKEGNVWCTTSDLYQQSMSIGTFIEDIHDMLSGKPESQREMQYLYLLEQEEVQ